MSQCETDSKIYNDALILSLAYVMPATATKDTAGIYKFHKNSNGDS